MGDKKKWVLYAGLILAGYMFHDKIATLPGVSKIPKF